MEDAEDEEAEIHEDLLYWSRNPIIENSSDSDFDEEINRPLRSWDEDILSYCRPMYKSYLAIIEAIIDQMLYYRKVYPTNYFQNFNFHGGTAS